jgi:hypothetical protein
MSTGDSGRLPLMNPLPSKPFNHHVQKGAGWWHYRVCGWILALATLSMTAQGDTVVASGHRRSIDAHRCRGNRYDRIGWEWVKAAGVQGWELMNAVCLTGHRDPDPATTSRKQEQNRRHRLEFQLLTFVYTTE